MTENSAHYTTGFGFSSSNGFRLLFVAVAVVLKLPNDNGDGYDDVDNHEDDGFGAISWSRQR